MLDHPRFENRLAPSVRRAEEIVVPSSGDDAERRGTGIHIILWRRRWIVLGCVLAALACGFAYLFRTVPIYSSASLVYIQQAVPKIVSDEISASANPVGYLYTQCMLIQSTAILNAALDKPGVRDLKCFAGMDNPVAFLKAFVVASPSKQGDFITVSMDSTNPQDAATIVNAVVAAFIDYQSKQHQSTAVEVLRILQRELDLHEAALKSVQDAIIAYKKTNPEIALDTDKGNINMIRLGSFYEALTAAQLRQIDLQTAVSEAEASGYDPVVLRNLVVRFQLLNPNDIVEPQALAAYKQDRQQLADLLEEYGPEYGDVRKLQRRIDHEQADLAQASQGTAKNYAEVLREALNSTNLYVTQLQKEVDEERKLVTDIRVKDGEYQQLVQQRDREVAAIDLLDGRMKDINVTEDVGTLTVSVLEFARPDFQPVRPKRGQTMGLALVAALMVGLGGALLRDMLDQRLRSADEIAQLLDLPILGAVPHMMGKVLYSERGLETHLRPRSDVAEAYRTIRTALYFVGANVKSPKTILITSPASEDGKSTLISNLAIAIAQAGRRVLIIDADCRRPTQHKIFKLAEGPGLSSVLAGKVAFARAVQRTGIEKLEILQCGPIPHNPAEILNGQEFLNLLHEASKVYDQILIDSPPVMPVTDARILAASCDATVLVVRAQNSTRRLAEHARRAIMAVGGELIGVVVNDVSRGQDHFGYYRATYTRYENEDASGNGNGDSEVEIGTGITGPVKFDERHALR